MSRANTFLFTYVYVYVYKYVELAHNIGKMW